ncbi:hypothetical protein BSKO_02912 [Bryopsis sp. KO-2023]|nr:hypothetical protein BSKO_02912 [Bryopsis sp. KO-2023]
MKANWFQKLYSQPPPLLLHLSFVLASWTYSGMHVLSKPALHYLPPYVFATIRVLMGLPFMYLISRMEKRVELTWADNGQLMVIGLFGIGIGQSVVFVANTLIGAGILSMMIPLATVLTVVMSAILGLERIGVLKVIGVTLTVAGSVAIAWVTEKDFHSNSAFWGVALMFLQAIASSTYFILMSKFLKRKPIPLYAYFRASVWGFVFILSLGAVQVSSVQWGEIPNWVWPVEMYCGIVVSSGAHVMMSWLIKHCAAFLPSLYISLQPVMTVTLAALFLNEKFNAWLLLCMFTILSGLFLVITVQARETKQASLESADAIPDEKEDGDTREPLLPTHLPISNE